MSDAERQKIQDAWKQWRDQPSLPKIHNLTHQDTFYDHFLNPQVRN